MSFNFPPSFLIELISYCRSEMLDRQFFVYAGPRRGHSESMKALREDNIIDANERNAEASDGSVLRTDALAHEEEEVEENVDVVVGRTSVASVFFTIFILNRDYVIV